MYNHMVGRTASVISPFYSLLPDFNPFAPEVHNWLYNKAQRASQHLEPEIPRNYNHLTKILKTFLFLKIV